MRRLALAAVVLAAGAAIVMVAVRGPAPARSMSERVREVAAGLRCPVCQNLSVADSPSTLAVEMRATIAQQLGAGMTPDAIRGQFVASYGEWILESPPKRGIDLLAWLVPALLVLGGLVAGALAVRRWTLDRSPGREGRSISAGDRAMLDRALAARLGEDEA
jgi:cytochrome c-type biogenesis protein CcmH